ncbi:hypothetical protein D8Y22_18410 [Salinadaptatus halalkaliphilus]|uniref:Blue (type 1) copper domain-containing protein n=1 Tax=Salinadaptatus halalkaliphilus TaxID=2419781 RepID=A0A4S3THM1_9EURY|nr:hypothetical protein [Salinadaptatus halalkaliphilus]THE63421.1 hypothetical protein D8Y22_18410 [Salinadaptatus halalkaliphilus]
MAFDRTERRTFLSTIAGSLAATTVAGTSGCLGTGEPDAETEPEPVVDEADALEGDTDPDAWQDVHDIQFDGWVGGWVGVEPAAIDRVENPMLVLFEGQAYELTWQNRDGVHHNVAFWDDDREVVDGYATDGNEREGATETLRFEATPAIDTYRCEYQPAGQVGDVEIVTE